MGFEVGALGVGGDLDVGKLLLGLGWLGGGLGVRLVGRLDEGVGSWNKQIERKTSVNNGND